MAATLLCCVAALNPRSWISVVGAGRLVRWLADRSYELYLVHVPLLLWIDEYGVGFGGLRLLGVRLVACIATAAAVHRLVEPIRHGHRLASPGRLSAALAVPALVILLVPTVWPVAPVAPSAVPSSTDLALLAGAPSPPRAAHAPGAAARRTAEPTPVAAAPQPTIWWVGDSTIRELDDAAMTEPTLSHALADAGFVVTGGVGFRGLAACEARTWDARDVGGPKLDLPAAVDAVGSWFSVTPADLVLVQVGANDIARRAAGPEDWRSCIERFLDALPPDVSVMWVVPYLAPWCWCDELAAATSRRDRFETELRAVARDHPRLVVIDDGLAGRSDARDLATVDGLHATTSGRATRIDHLVTEARIELLRGSGSESSWWW
ncbi:MAG: hypothetical protein R2715_10640 [Ilumatobacteraceae bacterium]